MPSRHDTSINRLVGEAERLRREREKTYRERALKLFPWVCGHCGRDFDGKRLRELTVHHKDHNHDNNPPDGSNWELLCIYCHDNAHARDQVADAYDTPGPAGSDRATDRDFTDNPFAMLASLKEKLPGTKS
jgi:5-methylcytosine-specific restriction endonuclease McrA